jgi:ribosomal protein S18 acetylase RimI-like enzyme
MRDIVMDICRALGDAPTVDDWSRQQTKSMLSYSKLAALRTTFFYKLPSARLMIGSTRKRSAYMETHVSSGPAVDKVVNSSIVDEVTEEDLEDADPEGGLPPGVEAPASPGDGRSLAVAFGAAADFVEQQCVAILVADGAARQHWAVSTGREAAVDAATKAAHEAGALRTTRSRRSGTQAPTITEADIGRWENELWKMECRSRFDAEAAAHGALSGEVDCVFALALGEDNSVQGFMKVVLTRYESFIDDIAVHHESRKCGVAYELCHTFANFILASELPASDLQLRLQVLEDNTVAVHTYKQVQFGTWECPAQPPYVTNYDSAEEGAVMMSATFGSFASAAKSLAQKDMQKRSKLRFMVCYGRRGEGFVQDPVRAPNMAAGGADLDADLEEREAAHMELTSDAELALALAPSKVGSMPAPHDARERESAREREGERGRESMGQRGCKQTPPACFLCRL